MQGRDEARRIAQELMGEDVLTDDLSDAVQSDEQFLHLAIALHNIRHADRAGGEFDTAGGLLAATESGLETLAERRLDQLLWSIRDAQLAEEVRDE